MADMHHLPTRWGEEGRRFHTRHEARRLYEVVQEDELWHWLLDTGYDAIVDNSMTM